MLKDNIIITYYHQFVVTEFNGWYYEGKLYKAGEVINLTKKDFEILSKDISLIPIGKLRNDITNDLNTFDTIQDKKLYIEKVKAKFEFEEPYENKVEPWENANNEFINWIIEIENNYNKILSLKSIIKKPIIPNIEKLTKFNEIKWKSNDSDLYYLIHNIPLTQIQKDNLKKLVKDYFIDKYEKPFKNKKLTQAINNVIITNNNKSEKSYLIDEVLNSSLMNKEINLEKLVCNLTKHSFINQEHKENFIEVLKSL
ncbi:MAG: hypothetical protein EHM58_05410 [Ignavibacteriae bacterium]|nr:MAG: hypothetical protein EHM58_05410 [Ignavibacteriota bacterium]